MTTAVVPATNPLADLLQEPAFLDLVLERPSATMTDLPDLLRSFSGRERYVDPYAVTRLIDITESFVYRYPTVTATARFLVVPEELWRRASSELPISDTPAPSGLVWAEPGYRHGRAVVVPNTGGPSVQIMLYRLDSSSPSESAESATLTPVRFPVEPAGPPSEEEADCRLTLRTEGDFAVLDCSGHCEHGTCTASRYHMEGRPEMVEGCYCG